MPLLWPASSTFLESSGLTRSRRGLAGRFLEGYSAGGRIYGYITEPVYETDASGRIRKRVGSRILVHPEEAEIVKRMYKRYAAGYSLRDIAEELIKEKVPNVKGLIGETFSTSLDFHASEFA